MSQLVGVDTPTKPDSARVAAHDLPETLTGEGSATRRRKKYGRDPLLASLRVLAGELRARVQVGLHVVESDVSQWHQPALSALAERGNYPALEVDIPWCQADELAHA